MKRDHRRTALSSYRSVPRPPVRRGAAALAGFLALTLPLFGATYYVDFEGGNNAADGLTPETAWKHSPGDARATDRPKAAALQPGDTVIFKGGVQYLGEIELTASGAEGRPIVLDGNTAGTFGRGRAVLDGASIITGWKPVESAEQVEGNPNWKEIMYADLDADLTSNFNQDRFVLHRDAGTANQAPWQRVFLIDGERRLLPLAMSPKPSDPFYPDLPSDFFLSPHRLADDYPHKVYYEQGTIGNRSLPLFAITYGGPAPVIQPFNGGAVSVDLAAPAVIAEMGFTLFRPASTPAPEHIVFLADGKEILKAEVDPKQTAMQRFKLPEPVEARKLTFRLLHSNPGNTTWTKLQQIAAFTPAGENVILHRTSTVLRDDERLTHADPKRCEGLFVGVHGGNNHVYFARVRRYDPATHRLFLPYFEASTYEQTRYAFFNAPRFIEQPGEWCLAPAEGGRTRAFLWPDRREGGQPVNIGYAVLKNGILLTGVSHVEVRGFLVQRYAAGFGGIATRSGRTGRPSHIRIADCVVRFVSGQSGITLNHTDAVTVENCVVHECPGWTVGIYVNRTNDYQLLNNRVVKNSGSGIRHYEAKRGVLRGNAVLDNFGMHSSGINLYEGCADILLENNYIQNTVAINRNAERLTLRNNVLDGDGRGSLAVGMWGSGSVGGRDIKDVHFINNTMVNLNPSVTWATGILAQGGSGGVSAPQGLVVRNNILPGMTQAVSGAIENNIYTREVEARFMGPGCQVIADLDALFRDPAARDFRRKAGGPAMDVGADVPPPPEWKR